MRKLLFLKYKEDIYMLIKEDIFARLQNGEDANDIANELINALNEANNQFQEEEEAKAKAAAEAVKGKELQKMADLQQIIDLMHDFCIEYYCDTDADIDTVHAAFATLDAKTVNEMIEEAGAYAVKMAEIQKHFDQVFGNFFSAPTIKVTKKGSPAPEAKSADAVIGDFLSSMGLK